MGYRDDAYGAEQGTPLNGGGMARRRQQHHTPYRDDSNFHGRSPYGPASPQGSLGAVPAAGYGHSSDAGSLGAKDAKGHRVVASVTAFLRRCGCSSHAMRSDEGPDGRYYRDDFNDQSWACAFGTGEEHGIWMNQADEAGTVMALMVWVLMGYSAVTIIMLAETGGIPASAAMVYTVLCSLSLASHAKTSLTDPGAIPQSAVPPEEVRKAMGRDNTLSMCSQCQTFKPLLSHHCRICNRCVSRMDHHCPWMNNCVGAANLKHFCLFLAYTWICTAYALTLLGWNYFFCSNAECEFTLVLTQLVRVMTVLGSGAFLFTSSMIMNVTYGLLTGIGTIDRMKKKATDTMLDSEEEPIPLKDVFGIAGYHTWPFPVDPVFEDFDRVIGYSTPQRLLREQMKEDSGMSVAGSRNIGSDFNSDVNTPSYAQV